MTHRQGMEIAASIVTFAAVISPYPAAAHAFGQRYDLPVPLALYVTGAGATVALSFAVMALFMRRQGDALPSAEIDLSDTAAGRAMCSPLVTGLLRIIFAGLFLLVVVAGFIGVDNPQRNIAPVTVWIVGWIGVAYISALFGDLWSLVNPWSTIYRWVVRDSDRVREYPAWLGMWPAIVLFWTFACLELVSESGESPRQLAFLIIMYSAVTWGGMAVFGPRAWLSNGEAFSAIFSLFGRFAPLGQGRRGRLVLRPPAVGLLTENPVSFTCTVFVLLILSTVTFDGFLETPAWAGLLQDLLAGPAAQAMTEFGLNPLKTIKTLAMLAFLLGFIGVYLLCCHVMALAEAGASASRLAGSFVLPLVPIAIAYHLAHYLSYLLISGQAIIPLASDPFGFGWDLFGSADYRTDIGIIGARAVWYLSVASIVMGHLLAVYLSHRMALRVFSTARAARRSQAAMLALMVAYTMVSLWILSQPVVSAG
ncbi:MAG: hypothetical protein WD767_08435 [Alphaproteobacteria bacterium]